jgi:hypothetical protein
MGWLGRIIPFAWSLDRLPVPWGDRPSIFGHIRAHVAEGRPGLTAGGETLPDEALVFGEEQIRWVAGGLDGALGHHGGAATAAEAAASVFEAMAALMERATSERLAALYGLLTARHALEVVDPLLRRVAASNVSVQRLHTLATFLVSRAPDREPVKVAIALLGLFSPSPDRELLLLLGRHEELTLFAATALANTQEDHEAALLELAQHVTGWGRIATVERLAGTTDPRIRAWLLREGYKNSVMHEYLARTCATSGDLVGALKAAEVDDALLKGAGDLLMALIAAPSRAFEGIDAYPDGVEVIRLYLQHLRNRAASLEELLAVHAIAAFLKDEDADVEARLAQGFTPGLQLALEAVCDDILALPHWVPLVEAELGSDDPERFYRADRAAQVLGIDTWERHLARLESFRSPSWYHAARTDDPDRLARFLNVARERLPLTAIATGPGKSLGMAPEHAPHAALDFVLQALLGFPGQGWEFVRAGLASPVVRNRTGAVRALTTWGREAWPGEAETVLLEAAAREPEADLRARLEGLLASSDPVN